MTVAEKRSLGHSIRKLPQRHLMGVWHIVSSGTPTSSDLVEFDIDTLPPHKTRELRDYVRAVLASEHSSTSADHLEPRRLPAEAEESSFSLSAS
jgi:hypothetical protein